VLSGKVALVTGASRGLGRACALALGKAGADVVLTDILLESHQKENDLTGFSKYFSERGIVCTETTAREIRGLGMRALALHMDVADREEVKRAFSIAANEMGGIHILVNNAAAMDHSARLEQHDDGLWDRDMKVNSTGVYNCCKAVWEQMKKRAKEGLLTYLPSWGKSEGTACSATPLPRPPSSA